MASKLSRYSTGGKKNVLADSAGLTEGYSTEGSAPGILVAARHSDRFCIGTIWEG